MSTRPVCSIRFAFSSDVHHAAPSPFRSVAVDRRSAELLPPALQRGGCAAGCARLAGDRCLDAARGVVDQPAHGRDCDRGHRRASAGARHSDARRGAPATVRLTPCQRSGRTISVRRAHRRRHASLSPLPLAAPPQYPDRSRSRSRIVGAFPDLAGKPAAQDPPRSSGYHGLPAPGCPVPARDGRGLPARPYRPTLARRAGLLHVQRAARPPPHADRRILALCLAVAGAATYLVSTREPPSQHRRACGGWRGRRPLSQHPHDAGPLVGARAVGALLGELPPGASPADLLPVLEAAAIAPVADRGGIWPADGTRSRRRSPQPSFFRLRRSEPDQAAATPPSF